MSDFTYEQNDIKTPLETYEWDNTWWDHAGTEGVPRVLLIGDSISVGTRRVATATAEEKIYFDGYGTSKALDNPYFCDSIRLVAAQQRGCDMVMFNNGLHGFHLEDETAYRGHYENVIRFLVAHFKEIPVVLLLSTSVAKEERDRRVVARNKVVMELAQQYNLPVIDLYTVTAANKHLLSDGVHFVQEGYEIIAKELVEYACKNIPALQKA